jgi:hypothetical protein
MGITTLASGFGKNYRKYKKMNEGYSRAHPFPFPLL